ncbi:hypothetical protein [Streptomyces scabiei]|uniref:hypothetical protein n=1 Tax=Streptomyces scabiei TaxID=1930 RepID=UPI0029A6570C|nr:hypothetical protein [Streptomyces scabiei]MDX3206037.1 hypothetical protein [Streptomyces scabiei]
MADIIRVTVVFEYEPEVENYGEHAHSLESMARLDEDVNNWVDYPDAYEDDLVSVTYEAVSRGA